MVNLTKADQMFGKNSQMSWQTEKACEKLGTIWDWTEIIIIESENLGFLLCKKNSLTWAVKWEN